MPYSVRMRAAQGGAHEEGGRHISGAERIVSSPEMLQTVREMISRALDHSRGKADFINITVETVAEEDIVRMPLLSVMTVETADAAHGRVLAAKTLEKAGVASKAVKAAMAFLLALPDSMRGAAVFCAQTGVRMDDRGARGIRVSRMDIAEAAAYEKFLSGRGLNGTHVREALVLATKVANAPGMAAELCWSDDPEYTAGYVATPSGYIRFPQLKPYGSPVGGRVFFVNPGCNLDKLIEYLEKQAVLVEVKGADQP